MECARVGKGGVVATSSSGRLRSVQDRGQEHHRKNAIQRGVKEGTLGGVAYAVA